MYLVFIGEVSNTVSVKELFKYCICDQEIKGGTHIGAAFDPLDPGAWATEISILGIPAELLKSCIITQFLLFSFNNLGKKVAPTHSGKKKLQVTSSKKRESYN